jgi:hypothetical protein
MVETKAGPQEIADDAGSQLIALIRSGIVRDLNDATRTTNSEFRLAEKIRQT